MDSYISSMFSFSSSVFSIWITDGIPEAWDRAHISAQLLWTRATAGHAWGPVRVWTQDFPQIKIQCKIIYGTKTMEEKNTTPERMVSRMNGVSGYIQDSIIATQLDTTEANHLQAS